VTADDKRKIGVGLVAGEESCKQDAGWGGKPGNELEEMSTRTQKCGQKSSGLGWGANVGEKVVGNRVTADWLEGPKKKVGKQKRHGKKNKKKKTARVSVKTCKSTQVGWGEEKVNTRIGMKDPNHRGGGEEWVLKDLSGASKK